MFSQIKQWLRMGCGCLVPVIIAACGGGGSDSGSAAVVIGTGAPVTVSGTIYYERPWYQSTTANGSGGYTVGLTGATQSFSYPARGITIEVLNVSTNQPYSEIASVKTDDSGNYSVQIPGGTRFRLGMRAEVLKASTGQTYSFYVRDNTQCDSSGVCPIYVYYNSSQDITAAGTTQTATLTAPSNCTVFSSTSVINATPCAVSRPSAPFAILDTARSFAGALTTAQTGITQNLSLTPLNFYWSAQNRAELPSAGNCANRVNPTTGEVGTTHFRSVDVAARTVGTTVCPMIPWGVYVLGDAVLSASETGSDFDEYDAPVIAHELGHFYEQVFSRSDSLGGPHDSASYLDMTVSWSEGFANAFSSIVRNDPGYSDAMLVSSQTGLVYYSFNVENHVGSSNIFPEGWFSERSVQELVWDINDSSSVSAETDNLALGFTEIHRALVAQFPNAASLASIYKFADALTVINAANATPLSAMLQAHGIYGTGEFGDGETNAASTSPSVLPHVTPVVLNTTHSVVSSNPFPNSDAYYASYNRIGARRYLRLVVPSPGDYQIGVTGPTSPVSDPDIFLTFQGSLVGYGVSAANGSEFVTSNGSTTSNIVYLPYAGTYLIEVVECSNIGQLCGGSSSTARGATTFNLQAYKL